MLPYIGHSHARKDRRGSQRKHGRFDQVTQKLRPLARHKVIKILNANGFQRVRSRKHITYKKEDNETG
jgi:hypothetical protein